MAQNDKTELNINQNVMNGKPKSDRKIAFITGITGQVFKQLIFVYKLLEI